ncbi:type IV secretion system protein [Pseudobacillus sp. 179-B 2D1 NHS]|uniref:type IV secretion system protein n=1 Tax=Pseudobacillus sp. 179-B 2D1 NHS TaxID=3374292 RepID=UPI00387990DA
MLGISEKFFEIIENLFRGIFEALMFPFKDLHDLKSLIYGIGADDKNLLYNTFTAKEIESVLVPGVSTVSFLVGFFLVLGIIVSGAKISTTSLNPSSRTALIEAVRDWFFVAIVLWNIDFLYEILFTINKFIVGVFSTSMTADLNEKIGPKLTGDNFFGWMLVMVVVTGLTIWANFYYLMRKLTLMILMILGPVFLSLWMFNGTKKVTLSWLRELFGTIMVQSVHAMTFWVIGTIATGLTEAGDVGFIELTMLYVIVIPAGEAIRSLLNLGGDMNNKLTSFAAQTGMAALNNMVGAVKGAIDGNGYSLSPNGTVSKNANSKSGSVANALANAVGVGNTKTDRMIRRGDIMSRMGKGVLGSMAGIAASPLGANAVRQAGDLGQMIGDKAGGLAGRSSVAAADVAAKVAQRGLEGIKGSGSELKKEAENEKLARELGQIHTGEWARQNEKDIKDQIRSGNPLLDEEGVESKWQAIVGQKKGEFTNQARSDLKSGLYSGANHARGSELANAAAAAYTSSLNSNSALKDSFIEKARQQGMNLEEAEQAWANHVRSRGEEATGAARSIVADMAKGKPLDSFIRSDEFANRFAQNRLEAEKQSFVKDFMQQNPSATSTEALQAWQEQEPARAGEIINQMSGAVSRMSVTSLGQSGSQVAKASDLAQEAAKAMTNQWGTDNKDRFITQLKQQGVSEVEIGRQWEQAVQSRFNDNMQTANMTAMKLADGKSLSTPINRKAFAAELGQSLVANAKSDFIQQQTANGLSEKEAEQGFMQSGITNAIESNIHSAVARVPELPMSKGFEMREAIAHQTASKLTDQWATPQRQEAFVKSFSDNYASNFGGAIPEPHTVEQAWKDQVGKVYQTHVSDVADRISLENTKGFVMPGVGSIVKGTVSGFAQGSGIKQVISESKVAHVTGAFKQGLTDGAGFRGSVQVAKTAAEAFVPVNAVEKAQGFQNKVAYTGALLGGVGGYALASKYAQKLNPYNDAVQNSTMEVSDIARHAKTEVVELGNGQTETRIASGAVQLVVERDRSYVQVQGKDNQINRVSGYGPGNPALQEGQVVFQDYSIEQDMLVPRTQPGMKSSAYMKDTAGYKVPYENPLPVNAGNLVANRRVIMNQMQEPMHDAFNQQVLNDAFTVQDFQAHSADKKATVVVEQHRSYVAMSGEGGKMYRVSPFGQGNPSLTPGQVQYKEYVIENARFTDNPSSGVQLQTYEYSQGGEKVPVESSSIDYIINPNDVISHRPNPRLEKRQKAEKKRFKQGVI